MALLVELKKLKFKKMNKELKKIDQLPKYRPKDCWSCDQNHEKSINSLCDFHIKYSYERILRKEREDIQLRSVIRIILWVFTSLFLAFMFPFFTVCEFGLLTVFALAFLGFILYLILYIFNYNERQFKKYLVDHKKDKAEWIRN